MNIKQVLKLQSTELHQYAVPPVFIFILGRLVWGKETWEQTVDPAPPQPLSQEGPLSLLTGHPPQRHCPWEAHAQR